MANKLGFNKYEIFGEVTVIYLKDRNKNVVGEAIIDTEDLQKLIDLDWSWNRTWHPRTKRYYVYATEYLGMINGKPKYKSHKLHKIVLNEKSPKIDIDHIDHDPYNNRKSNLRITTNSKNSKNRDSKNSNNTSGHRNVSWINGYWRIQLQVDGKNHMFREKFSDVDEAGLFAEEMRQKYYGDHAGLS